MKPETLEALKQFQENGYGLADSNQLEEVIEEFKRTETFLRALKHYDLALFRLAIEQNSFELTQSMRKIYK